MEWYNIKMRNHFLVGSILLFIFILFVLHIDKLLQYRQIELKRETWLNLLASEQNKQLPSGRSSTATEEDDSGHHADGPGLLAQLEYLKRIDPALGVVPYENLIKANQEMDLLRHQRAPIGGVNWEERGPNNVGGRTRAIMFDPNDMTHKKVWAGSIGGGLWYTNDITVANPVWNKVDDMWNNIAISTLAYNPANTQQLYAGTGEGWNNGAQQGSGMWKSSNGGSSWSVLASTIPPPQNFASDWRFINKIVVKNNGYMYAATSGIQGPGGGIMRSIDGGNTWTKVLSIYPGSGQQPYNWAADIEVAVNGDLYCSFGMIFTAGRVYKSTDANNGASGTWTDLSPNIVMGNARRTELACAPSDANVIYAVANGGSGNDDIEWFKVSIDGGTTWSSVAIPRLVDDSTTHFTRSQALYDLILAVHPTNSNYVLAGGIDLHRTTNGGTNWTWLSYGGVGFGLPLVHADQHMIVFRPGASNEAVISNDGGIYYSTDVGNINATPTFSVKNTGYSVTEFYTCAVKNMVNNHFFLAGAQDNGTQLFTSPQANSTVKLLGSDGGFCHIDQLNPNILIGAGTDNYIQRSLNGGDSFSAVLEEVSGWFVNPSEYDSQRKIYYSCANIDTLNRVSGIDSTLTISRLSIAVGGSKVCALKLSPYNDVVFLGINGGRIYKLTNASTASPTLTRIDNGATPITSVGWVSSIDVGANDDQILVNYSNYGVISVWETTDGGSHWYNKEGNLPNIPVLWILYNPENRNQVLAATEISVWSTDNFQPGTNAAPVWGSSNTGLANTRCTMLRYRPADKLVAVSTAGRGLFTSDIFVTTPVADFIVDETLICPGSLTAHFIDASLKANNSWAWDIDNNGTTDYTVRNPTHTYSTAGTYSVKLTINAGGTSITKVNLIIVPNTSLPTPNTECTVPTNMNLGNTGGYGIYRFALGQIDNTTPNNDGSYQVYSCPQFATLNLNTLYDATIQTGIINNSGAKVYLDYNDSGVFETGETILTFPSNTEGTRTLPFTTPASGVISNRALLLRVISRGSVPANPCDIGVNGQVEDYSVYFPCNLVVTLTSGSASGSLRAAFTCANPGDTIRISASLANQTLNIGSSAITINKNVVIMALGANTIITGSGARIFSVSTGINLELSNVSVIAGTSLTSGAINNSGILKLNNSKILRNPGIPNATLIRNQMGSQMNTFGNCFINN